MPITPAYTWEQTDDLVKVIIKSVSINRKNISLYGPYASFHAFSSFFPCYRFRAPRLTLFPPHFPFVVSDVFVKLSSPPLLLQLDLVHPIVAAQARAVLTPAGVDIHLPKPRATGDAAPVPSWPSLTLPASVPAAERLSRRAASIAAHDAAAAAARAAALSRDSARKAAAREADWDLDARLRALGEKVEVDERRAAVDGLLALHKPQGAAGAGAGGSVAATPAEAGKLADKAADTTKEAGAKPAPTAAATAVAVVTPVPARVLPPPRSLPPPRRAPLVASSSSSTDTAPAAATASTATGPAPVLVTFTPRTGPLAHLPAREAADRKALLTVRALTRARLRASPAAGAGATGAGAGQLTETEQQAFTFKDKGDAFARAGSVASALAAYTQALALDGFCADALANRAGVHLKAAAGWGAAARAVAVAATGTVTAVTPEGTEDEEVEEETAEGLAARAPHLTTRASVSALLDAIALPAASADASAALPAVSAPAAARAALALAGVLAGPSVGAGAGAGVGAGAAVSALSDAAAELAAGREHLRQCIADCTRALRMAREGLYAPPRKVSWPDTRHTETTETLYTEHYVAQLYSPPTTYHLGSLHGQAPGAPRARPAAAGLAGVGRRGLGSGGGASALGGRGGGGSRRTGSRGGS
jgi:hypothetical protein